MSDKSKTFDLSKYKNLSIKSFSLRELSGEDELAALERSTGSDGKVHGGQLRDHLIAESITAVNGEVVQAPFLGWKAWSTRTRDFVREAFATMNDASPEELSDFRKAALGS